MCLSKIVQPGEPQSLPSLITPYLGFMDGFIFLVGFLLISSKTISISWMLFLRGKIENTLWNGIFFLLIAFFCECSFGPTNYCQSGHDATPSNTAGVCYLFGNGIFDCYCDASSSKNPTMMFGGGGDCTGPVASSCDCGDVDLDGPCAACNTQSRQSASYCFTGHDGGGNCTGPCGVAPEFPMETSASIRPILFLVFALYLARRKTS